MGNIEPASTEGELESVSNSLENEVSIFFLYKLVYCFPGIEIWAMIYEGQKCIIISIVTSHSIGGKFIKKVNHSIVIVPGN